MQFHDMLFPVHVSTLQSVAHSIRLALPPNPLHALSFTRALRVPKKLKKISCALSPSTKKTTHTVNFS